MSDLMKKVNEAVAFIRKKVKTKPTVAIILGTGLSKVGKDIKSKKIIHYKEIPHFPLSTVESHTGALIFGKLSGKNVVCMSGRFHFYEGYAMEQITLPVRVMRKLGAKTLLVSNAGGGLNPQFECGDLMIIEDHINLMGASPLIGQTDPKLGPRFPDMSEPFSKKLIALAEQIGLEEGIKVRKGVYVAVTGPNLETRAEYRFLRGIGADAVGMSTVPEVIVARQVGFQTFGMTVVTDMCLPDALEEADIHKIIGVANRAEPKLAKVVEKLVGKI
ncbi:MAG: purine-nucleoside phosphorylase [Planctomycetes bacterium]|nr:purine-nucleoside phosphorylase [Planctomycetota bacterium]